MNLNIQACIQMQHFEAQNHTFESQQISCCSYVESVISEREGSYMFCVLKSCFPESVHLILDKGHLIIYALRSMTILHMYKQF